MQNNSKGFRKSFKTFVTNRVTGDLDKYLLFDAECSKARFEIETQEQKIKACGQSVEAEQFDAMFDKLMSIYGELENTVSEAMYLQGMKDGFRLCCMLAMEEKEA